MNLRQRILTLVLVLLLLVLGVTLATVSRVTYQHTLDRAEEELVASRRILLDNLEARDRSLREAAGTLAKDDALRQAVFSGGDQESVRLALDNHRRRTNADLALLVDLDGVVLADTGLRVEGGQRGRAFPMPEFLVAEAPTSPRLITVHGAVYQLVCVPYYVPVSAPTPSLWLLLGRSLDDPWARSLRDLTGIEVSIVGQASAGGSDAAAVFASSLPAAARAGLSASPGPASPASRVRRIGGEEVLALAAPLSGELVGLLDRPTAAALLDFRKLLGRFIWIALAAATLALAGAWQLARSVTEPIRSLEKAAQRIAAGDYAAALPIGEVGEVGRLAQEFEGMQRAVREREAAIEHLAFHDELTGLANRNRFRAELARRIAEAGSEHGQLAVAIVDIDRFREINDTLGHHVGDRLLIALARKLEAVATRRGHLLARLGGDEFALLLPARGLSEVREAITDVEEAFAGSIEIDDVRMDVMASTGVALYPEQGGDPATLLRRAEVAMYAAKKRRLGSAFYDAAQDRHSVERLSLAGDLRRAAGDGEFHLVYQPKLDLASARVQEVEVLLRWMHPRLGAVPPSEFIAVAERTGIIREITGWVLDRALAQAAKWRDAGRSLAIAVNLSALDLLHSDFPERLRQRLSASGFPADRLVLEITESSVMEDLDIARRILEEVTAMGARFSIDDFGTGYSSLAQLKRLPVQEIKVDRSFVVEMARSSDVAQIVRSTIELGHNLGLRVVGEGVDNHSTLELLREMGCDLAQGYFISPPLGAHDLELWLDARDGRGAPAARSAV